MPVGPLTNVERDYVVDPKTGEFYQGKMKVMNKAGQVAAPYSSDKHPMDKEVEMVKGEMTDKYEAPPPLQHARGQGRGQGGRNQGR